MDKLIMFYWSKGAKTRRKIVLLIDKCEKEMKPCYLNSLAKELSLSHVAVKKHIDLLKKHGYVMVANPNGKPEYFVLTEKGKKLAKEIKRKR